MNNFGIKFFSSAALVLAFSAVQAQTAGRGYSGNSSRSDTRSNERASNRGNAPSRQSESSGNRGDAFGRGRSSDAGRSSSGYTDRGNYERGSSTTRSSQGNIFQGNSSQGYSRSNGRSSDSSGYQPRSSQGYSRSSGRSSDGFDYQPRTSEQKYNRNQTSQQGATNPFLRRDTSTRSSDQTERTPRNSDLFQYGNQGRQSGASTGRRSDGFSGRNNRVSDTTSQERPSRPTSERRTNDGFTRDSGRRSSNSDVQFGDQGRNNRSSSRGSSVSRDFSRNRSDFGHYNSDFNARTSISRYRVQRVPYGNLGDRVNRQERIGVNIEGRYGGIHDGFRVGYYHYDRQWRDDNFFFGFYVFDPFVTTTCVSSPWYYYPCLPPYINTTRVIYVNTFPSYYDGDVYQYRPSVQYDDSDRYNSNRNLDRALDEITNAFQNDDQNAIQNLMPRDGQVNIYVDGKYDYSLNPDDFLQTYEDGIHSTKTERYSIEEVRWSGRDSVRVRARHEYIDPWGEVASVTHTYYLEREGSDFVIREFGTSR